MISPVCCVCLSFMLSSNLLFVCFAPSPSPRDRVPLIKKSKSPLFLYLDSSVTKGLIFYAQNRPEYSFSCLAWYQTICPSNFCLILGSFSFIVFIILFRHKVPGVMNSESDFYLWLDGWALFSLLVIFMAALGAKYPVSLFGGDRQLKCEVHPLAMKRKSSVRSYCHTVNTYCHTSAVLPTILAAALWLRGFQ